MARAERDTTPSIADIAARGQAFDRCFAHDIWTRPSSASILTGRASSAHRTWSNDARLPQTVRTIPEAFGEAGYRTACVSPNGQLSPSTGLDRGFDTFNYLIKSTLVEEAGLGSIARWLLGFRRHTGGLTTDGSQHCIGYLTNRIAKRHIRGAARDDESLFLYVHHGDSHHAYVPPLSWRDHFAADLPMPVSEAIEVALRMSDGLHEHIGTEDPFTTEEWQALEVLYDTAIAYVDHLVGDLVSYARTHLDDPIVVITGDHGELFGEHGLLAHMLVANTAVSNVPLVVDGLDGSVPEGLIQHADVMAMLCADLGIDHDVPVGIDRRERQRELAVTQRGGTRARQNLDAISAHGDGFDRAAIHTADLTSARTDQWRYQCSEEGAQLFALPDETADVSDTNPDVAVRIDGRLQEWLDAHGRPAGDVGTADFDEATQSHLEDLGYLQ